MVGQESLGRKRKLMTDYNERKKRKVLRQATLRNYLKVSTDMFNNNYVAIIIK